MLLVTLPFCLNGERVKLCSGVSLGKGQLCRGGQAVSRDIGWVTVGQRPMGEYWLHAAWLRERHMAAGLQIQILYVCCLIPHLQGISDSRGREEADIHWIFSRCYQGCYQPWQAGCCSGKCPLFWFCGLHKHLWKQSSTRVGNHAFWLLWATHLETSLSGFDDSLCCGNWSRALQANSVSLKL